jgi:hypothetical protein
LMNPEYKLKTTWGGEPDFHRPLFGGGSCVTVNGEEYRVVEVINPRKYVIRKEGFFAAEELILEKSWSGWRVRKRGWFE